MTVGDIARFLNAPVEGDPDLEISGVQSLEEAGPSEISFVEGRRAEKRARESRAGCLLASADFDNPGNRGVIRVSAPRNAFARVIRLFHRPHPGSPESIAPPAWRPPHGWANRYRPEPWPSSAKTR